MYVHACVIVHMCVKRAGVRACARAHVCVSVCVRACVRACMRACVCVLPYCECSKSKDQNVQCLPHATPASLLSHRHWETATHCPIFVPVCVAGRA